MTSPKLHQQRMHKCAECGTLRKLPWKGDSSSFCEGCGRMTWHEKQSEHVLAEDVGSRMEKFLRSVSWRTRANDAPVAPVAADKIAAALRRGDFPARQIENLPICDGPVLEASDLIHNWERPDAHFALYGTNGCGKTQIAVRVAALRMASGNTAGRYVCVPDLAESMKGAISKDAPSEDLFRPLRTCAFLVLDEAQDCGHGQQQIAWVRQALRAVADARYRDFKPLIWLLNAAKDTEVNELLGGRIVDRINETGSLIHCNWPSYR